MTLRLLTAAAVLVSAVVHLQLWFDGFREIPVIGPGFLLNAVGGAGIAVAVLVWRHWLPLAAAAAFGAATLLAFVLSATVGLFGVREEVLGVPQVVAAVSEVAAVVFAAWAWARLRAGRKPVGPEPAVRPEPPDRRRPRRSPRRADGAQDR